MKICIDLTALAFNFSGIERYAMCISKELIKSDGDEFVLLFCNEIHPAYTDVVKNKNIDAVVVKSKNNKLSKLWLFQVKNNIALQRINADAYVFLAFEPPVFFKGRKIITTIHDLGFFDCPRMWKWYISLYGQIKMSAAIHHSSRIVCVSEFTRSCLLRRFNFPSDKITVVYNAVDERFNTESITEVRKAELREKYNLPSGNFILCLGTIEPRKNMELLIDAYGELKANHELDKCLVIVGRKGWKVDQLLERLSMGARDDIRLTGFVDDVDLPDIYKMAECFVFPSVYEGFGIPPLEAISCGTQAIVSDIEVQREVMGTAAKYFSSNDKEDLKRALTTKGNIAKEVLLSRSKLYNWSASGTKFNNFINEQI